MPPQKRFSLNRDFPKGQRLSGIRHGLLSDFHLGITFRLAVWHLDVVLEDEAGDDHFDFVGGEEAAGAGVSSVAKGEVLFVSGDELIAGNVAGFTRGTRVVGAESVKGVGGGVDGFVGVDGG